MPETPRKPVKLIEKPDATRARWKWQFEVYRVELRRGDEEVRRRERENVVCVESGGLVQTPTVPAGWTVQCIAAPS